MAEHEATMKFVTNLDRGGIEAELKKAAKLAEAKNLPEVAKSLGSAAGKSRAELEQLVSQSIAACKGNPAAKGLAELLEMILLNLPNLK